MEPKPIKNERRRNARTRVNRPGRIRIGGGNESYTQLVNLSQRGAALYCTTALDPGTEVEVRFHLNIEPRTVWLKLRAKVDRCYGRGASHVVRILFIAPSLEALETIVEFIGYRSAIRESAAP